MLEADLDFLVDAINLHIRFAHISHRILPTEWTSFAAQATGVRATALLAVQSTVQLDAQGNKGTADRHPKHRALFAVTRIVGVQNRNKVFRLLASVSLGLFQPLIERLNLRKD